jgi:hypothetical protein
MSRAAELKVLLDPACATGESFKAYRKRRALANASVAAHMKGHMAHESTRVAIIPDKEWSAAHQEQANRGKIIITSRAVLKTGTSVRLVRTKGVTYRKAA